MANRLKMALADSILRLHGHGWSHRRIARELGVHRETVSRHVGLAASDVKPASNAPTGSTPATNAPSGIDPSKPANGGRRRFSRSWIRG